MAGKQDLKRQLGNIDSQVRSLQNMIDKCERECELLRQFKKSVNSSKGDFNTVNNKKKKILSDLDSVIKDNTVAKKYKNGMGSSLAGVGMSVVGLAFSGLVVMINAKQAEYTAKANGYRAQINGLKASRGVVQNKLKALEAAEKLMGE